MQELSLHILDIVENSIIAGAKDIGIKIREDLNKDQLSIEIKDNGKGMDKEVVEKVLDPFYTTRTTRKVGLGLSLFAEATRRSNGNFTINSTKEEGTTIQATFQHSNIDRQPLGNIIDTMVTLIIGNPEINLSYYHKRDDLDFSLNTSELKKALDGVPLDNPVVVRFIRGIFKEGLEEIGVNSW
ncbi:MAG: ATP-binding protein [Deltaproteobacteria bacterium]|nr:MAG: ATP-binding protein [Deltaproteobacteria bacterium]